MRISRYGFTVIELTVTVAVAAILSAISLPRALNFIDRIEVRGAVTEIESILSLGRHLALARGQQVTVDIDAGSREITVHAGAELIKKREVGKAHGIMLTTNRPSITYSPSGMGYGASNFTMTVSRNGAADTIVVSRLGRVRH